MPLSRLFFWRRFAPLVLLGALCAAAAAQERVGWGNNTLGQADTPLSAQSGVVAVAEGTTHSMVLKADGTIVAWGANNLGQCDVPASAQSRVIAISTRGYHVVALKSDGSVVAWGGNNSGQNDVPAAAQSGVTAIVAGNLASLALKDGGAIYWGRSDYGLADVPSAAQSGVVAIAAGAVYCLALKSNGKVVAWGNNNYGQCNVPVAAQSGVVAIAGGDSHCLALKSDGRVIAWGGNSWGQCNVPASAQSGVVAIAGGGLHSLALKSDGSVIGWGENGNRQATPPSSVQSGIVAIAGGYTFSAALRATAWATLAPSTVWSGDASMGTVHLANPAPVGGASVGLVSDDAGVHVPASVTVPAGATTATFPVTTDLSFSPDRTAKVRTTYGSETVPARLLVKGYTASLVFDHPNIAGGSTTGLMLKVGLPVPFATDTTFALSSMGPLIGVPANVTVPAGTVEVKIPLTTSSVAATQTATATLFYDGTSLGTATIQVLPTKGTLKFAPDRIESGYSTLATVYLTAATVTPVTVQLASGDFSVIVPDSVQVPAGQRTVSFLVNTVPTIRTLDVPVTATIGSQSFSKDLRITAVTAVRSVTGPTAVYGGGKATFTVTLSRPAGPDGYQLNLYSYSLDLELPPVVTVPTGATSATFVGTAADVDATASATVVATGQANSGSTAISLRPNVVTDFTFSSSTVASGGSVTGTVTLKAVMAVDTVVYLSSKDPLVTVPETVTIAAGSKTGTFTATAGSTAKSTNVTITASKSGVVLSKGVKVLP